MMAEPRLESIRTPQDLSIAEAAQRCVGQIAAGGLVIVPLDVAYAIVGNSAEAIARIFAAKRRSFDKPSGCFANWELFNEIQICGPRERDLVRAVILDNDLPLSTVAPFRRGHPFLAGLEPFALEHSSKAGTLDMLMNAGAFHNAMTALSAARQLPILGSSANTSLTGSKFRLDEVDAEVRQVADLAIDGGPSKYANPEGVSSTIIDLRSFKTVRKGVCYDAIAGILQRHFGIDLYANGMA
jgi:tRNA A37 threonylcarbamoyladenosine synthetase subunit TsaC/SUA5/YrdC